MRNSEKTTLVRMSLTIFKGQLGAIHLHKMKE